jgi:hypothetical protein
MRHWTLLAAIACASMTVACANKPTALWAAPRLEMPAEALKACDLHRLPDAPTLADLEIGYATRGAQLVACDAARRLAVETHAAEHALENDALKER